MIVPLLRRLVVLLALVASALPSPVPATEVQVVTTPAGTTAWLLEDHASPLVALRLVFPGGSAADPPLRGGATAMLARLLSEGAGDLDAAAFRDRSQRASLKISFEASRDAFFANIEFLARHRAEATELFALALQRPRLDTQAIARVRARMQAASADAEADPRAIAVDHWMDQAFSGHPYSRPVDGVASTLSAIDRSDLLAVHARQLRRRPLAVAAVGAIDAAALAAMLDTITQALPPAEDATPISIELRPHQASRMIPRDLPGASIVFGLPAIPHSAAGDVAQHVVAHILGSGELDSRLLAELRVRRGLVYSAHASLIHDRHSNYLVGELATSNTHAEEAQRHLSQIINRLAIEGPTEDEIADARSALIGSLLLGLSSSAALADSLIAAQLDRESPDYLARRRAALTSLTREDVNRAAKTLLATDRLVVTTVAKTTP